MFRRKPLILVGFSLLLGILACNAPGQTSAVTVSPGVGGNGATEALTEGPSATPSAVCTPPACTQGEILGCTSGTCPGGCGSVCIPIPPQATLPGAIPSGVPVSPFVPSDKSFVANYQNITFYIPYIVAGDWKVDTVPADPADSGAPDSWRVASHYKFTFPSYNTVNQIQPPRILVWPVKNWAPDYNPEANKRIAELTAAANHPDTIDLSQEIPVLPVFNAAQIIRAQVQPLAFQNGLGLRFVTYYSQALMPVNNAETIYTFQGVTNDGLYYVAAYFPVTHPSLVATSADIPGGDVNAFTANYTQYLADTTKTLNNAKPESFTPDLRDLDYIIQSFLISH